MFKPMGIWYSIDDAWIRWVKDEEPDWLFRYKHKHLVEINEDRILFVPGTVEALSSFVATYSSYCPGTITMKMIDWEKVAQEYDGVEFSPYNRGLYFGKGLTSNEIMALTFYSGIDVPSGCIWGSDAIKKIERLD